MRPSYRLRIPKSPHFKVRRRKPIEAQGTKHLGSVATIFTNLSGLRHNLPMSTEPLQATRHKALPRKPRKELGRWGARLGPCGRLWASTGVP